MMGCLPGWAKWLIIAAGVLFSPVLAFLFALAVAALLMEIKEGGVPAVVAGLGACAIFGLQVRRLRGARREPVGDT